MQRHVVIVYHEVGSTKAQLVQQLAVETGAFFKKEKAEQNRTKQKKNKNKNLLHLILLEKRTTTKRASKSFKPF